MGLVMNSRRVLFVDDEPAIRFTTSLLLKSAGYEVVLAEDGEKAIEAMRGQLPDVVISDLRMPGMSGFDLLARVRKKFPTVRLIAISAHYNDTTVPKDLPADAFFEKGSYSVSELIGKLNDLLAPAPPMGAARLYRPGEVAQFSGIYRSIHSGHAVAKPEVVGVAGDRFQPCDSCGSEVSYVLQEPLRHVLEDPDFKS